MQMTKLITALIALWLVGCTTTQTTTEKVMIDDGAASSDQAQAVKLTPQKDEFIESSRVGQADTLFQRLGGSQTLNRFSDQFVDALAKNPVILKNPAATAALAKNAGHFKKMLAVQLCELSGGPCKYAGKSMHEAHKRLNISQEEWHAMGTVFIKVLRNLGVQKNERVELANLVARSKKDIVQSPSR